MTDGLKYKGYFGSVHFNAESEVFHGRLEGIRDLITYEATDVAGLKRSFREAVDDYLATCGASGREPDVPYKGSFNVRVGKELHKRAALFASARKKRLNAVVTDALRQYLDSASR